MGGRVRCGAVLFGVVWWCGVVCVWSACGLVWCAGGGGVCGARVVGVVVGWLVVYPHPSSSLRLLLLLLLLVSVLVLVLGLLLFVDAIAGYRYGYESA